MKQTAKTENMNSNMSTERGTQSATYRRSFISQNREFSKGFARFKKRKMPPLRILNYVQQVLRWHIVKDEHFEGLQEIRKKIMRILLQHYKIVSVFIIKYARINKSGYGVHGIALAYWKDNERKYRVSPSIYVIKESGSKDLIDRVASLIVNMDDNDLSALQECEGYGLPLPTHILDKIQELISEHEQQNKQ